MCKICIPLYQFGETVIFFSDLFLPLPGLPLTQCRYAGDVYLTIRMDYALGRLYQYKELKDTEEYRLADEFNGVPEVDVEKLIANCEAVLAKCISIRKAAAKARLESV